MDKRNDYPTAEVKAMADHRYLVDILELKVE